MVERQKDLLLGRNVIHLLETNDRRLFQDFQCVEILRRVAILVRAKSHSTERPRSQCLPQLEVVNGQLLVSQVHGTLRHLSSFQCGLAHLRPTAPLFSLKILLRLQLPK